MKKLLVIITWFLFLPFLSVSQENLVGASSDKTLPTLIFQIDSLLEKSNNPAISIAIVRGDSILYASSLGTKNLETEEPATDSTLFRIGSISKMFVALAVLKLQEEGKISLKDKLNDWAPEIEYENPWKETNPILIEHLLEHTTGWDDLHLPEYAHGSKGPVSLKEGLDFHPHSRISRWVPGTRYSYCNSGPPVAAYILEKITGQSFEEYIEQTFFAPIGMATATYHSDTYQEYGATLYEGKNPKPYWHIIMRPSGAINATAEDMAKMLQFFINDATIDSTSLISKESLERMETPQTSIGARAGIDGGYGLHNYSSTWNGITFQGHNGGVNGGSSELAYNREHDIGFAVMVNSNNSSFRNDVSQLIGNFLTQGLPKDSVSIAAKPTSTFDGYYYAINPRQQINYFNSRLFNIRKIWSDDSLVYLADYPSGNPTLYQALSDTQAVRLNGKVGLVKTEDPLAGEAVSGVNTVFAPTSFAVVWASWIITALWIFGLLTAAIWSFVSLVRLLMGSDKLGKIHVLQLSTALIFICLVLSFFFLGFGSSKPFEYLAAPTAISRTIYYSSLMLGTFSLISVGLVIWNYLKAQRGITFWFFTTVTILSLIATLYLWDHGAIGLKTWG